MPFLNAGVAMTCWVTQASGKPNPERDPVIGWIQPIVISLLLVAPEVLLVEAPLIPELHASRRLPPPTTAAPTPAARNRLRREILPASDWLPAGSGWAVWSVMVLDLSFISAHPCPGT